MTRKWNVALFQMDVAFGDPAANRAKVAEWVERMAQAETKPDVILLPELWDTAYDLNRLGEIADEEGRQAQALLRDAARKLGCFVVGGSVAERTPQGVANTAYVFDRGGELIGRYSKVHLFRLMHEDRHLLAGEEPGLHEMDGHRVATVICYDIRFPEWVRVHALAGAKALFVCAQWPHPRLNHWRQLLIARAIENQMYVVACNRVGTDGRSTFCGHSMVVNPWGEVVAEGMQQEEIITAELDWDEVDKVRGRIPVFADRRSNLYRL